MPTDPLKSKHGIILRAASGALTAADRPQPLVDLGWARRAIVHIMQEAELTTPDADDHVRFHLETAYGEGGIDVTAELLAADIDDTQTNVPNDDSTAFVVGDVIRVDAERMLVTATDGATPGVITVERGYRGDARALHLDNAVISLLDVDWVEIAQVTYDDGDDGNQPHCVIIIGWGDTVILDDLDAALADNTVLAAPLGDRLRLRTSVAGATAPTYQYSVRVSLQN